MTKQKRNKKHWKHSKRQEKCLSSFEDLASIPLGTHIGPSDIPEGLSENTALALVDNIEKFNDNLLRISDVLQPVSLDMEPINALQSTMAQLPEAIAKQFLLMFSPQKEQEPESKQSIASSQKKATVTEPESKEPSIKRKDTTPPLASNDTKPFLSFNLSWPALWQYIKSLLLSRRYLMATKVFWMLFAIVVSVVLFFMSVDYNRVNTELACRRAQLLEQKIEIDKYRTLRLWCATDTLWSRHVAQIDWVYTDTIHNSRDLHALHRYLQSKR